MTDYAKHIETLQSMIHGAARSYREALTAAQLLFRTADAKAFNEVWALMEADGYQYGEEALQQVRLGWELACGARSRLAKELAELKHAATPKSPEEEQRHCLVIARTIDGRGDTVRMVYSQRAAARAEGYAQRKAEETRPCPACHGAVPESGCGRCFGSGAVAALRVEGDRLSAAQAEIAIGNSANARLQAEIERLQADYANAADGRAHFETELAERDAEIERLRGEAMLTASDKAFLDVVVAGVHERDELQTKLTNLRTAVDTHLVNTPKSHTQAVESDNALRKANEASR